MRPPGARQVELVGSSTRSVAGNHPNLLKRAIYDVTAVGGPLSSMAGVKRGSATAAAGQPYEIQLDYETREDSPSSPSGSRSKRSRRRDEHDDEEEVVRVDSLHSGGSSRNEQKIVVTMKRDMLGMGGGEADGSDITEEEVLKLRRAGATTPTQGGKRKRRAEDLSEWGDS